MSDITTINLSYPINSSHGAEINELRMRRPKVRDRLVAEKMSGNQSEKEVRFIANLCELAPEDIEELDMADYNKIQTALSGFLS